MTTRSSILSIAILWVCVLQNIYSAEIVLPVIEVRQSEDSLAAINYAKDGSEGITGEESRHFFEGKCNSLFYSFPAEITVEALWLAVKTQYGEQLLEPHFNKEKEVWSAFLKDDIILEVYLYKPTPDLPLADSEKAACTILLFLDARLYPNEMKDLKEERLKK